MRLSNNFFLLTLVVLLTGFINGKSVSGCQKKISDQYSLQSDTIILSEIKSVNKVKYIGLPVDSLFKNAIIAKYKSLLFMEEPPLLLLEYAKGIYIHIYVSENSYDSFITNPDNPRSWNLSAFKRQKLAQIDLVYKGDVIESVGDAFPNRNTIYIKGEDTVRANLKKQH